MMEEESNQIEEPVLRDSQRLGLWGGRAAEEATNSIEKKEVTIGIWRAFL